jgi:hypothetical protein
VIDFNHSIFSSAQAVLNATTYLGGNAVITIDAHDSITLVGVHSGQLHTSDFHILT